LPNFGSKKAFHEELYTVRIAKRLPRKAIALEAGIDVSYFAAIERGSRQPPSPDKLEKILNGLGVAPEERERLRQAAVFTRLKNQLLDEATPHMLEAADVITSIQRLSTDEIRLVKALISAIDANHNPTEAQM
jgi:transcriptional regulator with XRE-family HTH domain